MNVSKRKPMKGNSTSVDKIKNNLRLHFKEKLKNYRHEQRNKQRNLAEDQLQDTNLLSEYKRFKLLLLNEEKATNFGDTDTIVEMLNQVEHELIEEEQQRQAEEIMTQADLEIDAILSSSVVICAVCDNYIYGSAKSIHCICDLCAKSHFLVCNYL